MRHSFSRIAPLFLVLLISCANNSKLLLETAENAWAGGDRASALTCYEDFLRRYPGDPLSWRAHYGLGNAYYLTTAQNGRDLAKAEEHYRKIIAGYPQLDIVPQVWKRIADIKAEQGRRFEAIAEYENLLLRFPNLADWRRVRLTIAGLYHDMGNFSQAETECQKVGDAPGYDELTESALLRIASINQMRDRFEKALPALERLISNSRNTDIVHQSKLAMADCYARLNRLDETITVLRSIEDPRPGERKLIKTRLDSIQRQERAKPRMGEVDWRPRR